MLAEECAHDKRSTSNIIEARTRLKVRPCEPQREHCCYSLTGCIARNKLHNRFCEQLLHDIEFVGSLSHVLLSAPYPREELNRLWELLLLNQFHDVIPGTSIPEVFEDSEKHYALIREEGENLFSVRLCFPLIACAFVVNSSSVLLLTRQHRE